LDADNVCGAMVMELVAADRVAAFTAGCVL
jgi:hypothetical protein